MSKEQNWLEFFQNRERLYADYYLAFAEENARRDPEAYNRLEAESGNLLRVADWMGDHNELEGTLKLAEALWQESDFIRARGYMQRGLPLLEQACQAARQTGDSRAEFTCLEAQAYVHYSDNNFALAQPLYERALALAEDIEPRFKAKAQLGIGKVLMDMGHLEQSGIWLKRALHNYHQSQDYIGEIENLIALGNLLSLQGNFTGAIAYLDKGLLLAQNRQYRQGEVSLRFALGYVGTASRDWPLAIKHYEPVTTIAQAIGDRFLEVRAMHNLGEAWLEFGDVQRAIALLEEAVIRQETLDDVVTKTFTHFYLGKAYNILDKSDKSLAQLNLAYPRLLETPGSPVFAALATETAWIIADNYLKQNNTKQAIVALRDVIRLAPPDMIDTRQSAEALIEITKEQESSV